MLRRRCSVRDNIGQAALAMPERSRLRRRFATSEQIRRVIVPPMYETLHDTIDRGAAGWFADQLTAAVAHKEPVMAVLGVDEGAVLAVVDECIRSLLDQPLRIIRLRGSQGSPLTLPRIVQELGAAERGELPVDDDELIVRVLARPSTKKDRVVLVIEQADLLPMRTLAFLQVISTVFNATAPRLQLLFAGHPRLMELIGRSELAGLKEQLETVVQVANASTVMAPNTSTLYHAGTSRIDAGPPMAPAATHYKKPLVLSAALIVLIGAAFAVLQQNLSSADGRDENVAPVADLAKAGMAAQPPLRPTETQPPLPPSPPPATASAPSRLLTPPQPGNRDPDPAAATQPAKRRSVPSGEQLARLREEFEHFLAQTERGSKRQSEGERSRLFNEFLQWNYGGSGPGPEPAPQAAGTPALSQARVTLHFLAGSTNGKETTRQLATELRPTVALARTRSIADVPKTFELRYFAQEDESLAKTLAQLMQAPDAAWTVRIMPDLRPLAAPRMLMPHTIEVWIPLR